MTTIRDRVIGIIGDALSLSAEDRAILASDSAGGAIAGWDSAAHVELILALEDAFDFEIEVEAIARLNHVSKIVDYLEARGVSADAPVAV
jgi:acyl carrier protein